MNHSIMTPSSIIRVDVVPLVGSDAVVYIKREDLIHPHLSGNKWRKLKYNIDHILDNKLEGMVSFGGAFSNHIYAAAAAGAMFDFKVVLFIRGEISDVDNPTLAFCKRMGAILIPVTREEYRLRNDLDWLENIQSKYPEYHIVPEGGSNDLALEGVAEIMKEIEESDQVYDTISVSAGTGGTAAGMIAYDSDAIIHVYASLKGNFIEDDIRKFLKSDFQNYKVFNNYHQGGYARVNKEYISFLNQWYEATQVPLDPIYTGKMMYGIIDQLKNGELDRAEKHLVIHTGGLQGIAACNYLNGKKFGVINYGNIQA